MPFLITPDIEKTFFQLTLIERRRMRILDSVSAHFGRDNILGKLDAEKIQRNLELESIHDVIDESEPTSFLTNLALHVQSIEAATINCLRNKVTTYTDHIDEQILFGSRTAGQEAARFYLSQIQHPSWESLNAPLPEAVRTVLELTYNGIPSEKNFFQIIRNFGASSIHFKKSPHLLAWSAVNSDTGFLHKSKVEWMRGILDILNPRAECTPSHSIESGESYGLIHFHLRGEHALP